MKLGNIIKRDVDSAVDGTPTLQNFFTTTKYRKAKRKPMKMLRSVYGGLGYGLVDTACDSDGDGDGGGGE